MRTPHKRISLKQLAGVSNMKKAPPDVIKVAKTAQQYKQMAFNIKKKLLIAQKKEGNFQRIASTGFITRVDEMLVSRGAKIILHGELKNFKRKHRGRRWTVDEKLFALAIFKRSPRVYRFLQQHLTLSCESTLKNLLQEIPLQPGISEPLINLLKVLAS